MTEQRTGRQETAAPVAVITSARQSVADERAHRQKIYMVRMGMRTVMFVLAVALPIPVWAAVVIILASIPIPLLAVTTASQADVRRAGTPVGYAPTKESVEAAPRALPAAVTVVDAEPADRPPLVLEGEVVHPA